MKHNLLKLLLILIIFASCKKEESKPTSESKNTKKTGFVIAVSTPSNTSLVKYFDSIPINTADISDGLDFQRFSVEEAYDGALFLNNPDGTTGISKYTVNENGKLQKSGGFATLDRSDPLVIRDAQTGVYFDYGDRKKLTVFNPSTMQVSGTIDMSSAMFPRDELTRYRQMYIRDNLIYAPIGTDASVNSRWYDPLVVHVADINTGSYIKSMTLDLEGPVRHNQYFGGRYEDENGNLYITDEGDLLTSTPARLHKVNNGETEFDLSYEFDIATALNSQNALYRVYNSFYYIGNGKAIALVTENTPTQVLGILATVEFNPSKLNQGQIGQILTILNNAENAYWCELDLNAKSATKIAGIPSQNVNKRFTITEYEGKWYLPVENTSETAYYTYDPTSGTAEKAFNVMGGSSPRLINLANNN